MVNTLTDVGYSVRYSSFGSEIRRFACQMAISLLMYPQLCQLYTGPKLHYRHVPLPRSPQVAKTKGMNTACFQDFFTCLKCKFGGKTHTLDKSISSFNLFFTVFGLDEIEGTQIETLGPRLHHGLAKQVGIPISWYKRNCNVTNDSNAQFEAFISTDIPYGGFHFNRATPFIIHDKPSSYWGTSISGNSHIM